MLVLRRGEVLGGCGVGEMAADGAEELHAVDQAVKLPAIARQEVARHIVSEVEGDGGVLLARRLLVATREQEGKELGLVATNPVSFKIVANQNRCQKIANFKMAKKVNTGKISAEAEKIAERAGKFKERHMAAALREYKSGANISHLAAKHCVIRRTLAWSGF